MTVKELRKLLDQAPDDMKIYVNRDSAFGGFAFEEACIHESGPVDFGEPDEKAGEVGHATKGFIIMAHGSTSAADGENEGEVGQHALN